MRAERFWRKVDARGPDDCWEWLASVRRDGYGHFQHQYEDGHYGWTAAHRVAWFLTNGETDLFVLHKCDNRTCCNPAHLFLGTQLDNARDAIVKGRPFGRPYSSARGND